MFFDLKEIRSALQKEAEKNNNKMSERSSQNENKMAGGYRIWELKEFPDYEVLETYYDGVYFDAGIPVEPVSFPGVVIANDLLWQGQQQWINKGLGTYKVLYDQVR